MKGICRGVRQRLADEGPQVLREDAAAQRHLEECEECFGVLEGLARLDDALRTMPPVDAPDAVVRDLLARVEAEGTAAEAKPAAERLVLAPVARWALASVATVVVAVSLVPRLHRSRVAYEPTGLRAERKAQLHEATPPPTTPAEGFEGGVPEAAPSMSYE